MNNRNGRQGNDDNEHLPTREEVKSNSDADNDNNQIPNPLTAFTLADIQSQLGRLNNQPAYLSLLQQGGQQQQQQQQQVGSVVPSGVAGAGFVQTIGGATSGAQGSSSSSEAVASSVVNLLGALQQPQMSAHHPSSTYPNLANLVGAASAAQGSSSSAVANDIVHLIGALQQQPQMTAYPSSTYPNLANLGGAAAGAQGSSSSSSLLANVIIKLLEALQQQQQQQQLSVHPSSTYPSSTSTFPLHHRTLESTISGATHQLGSILGRAAVPNAHAWSDLRASAAVAAAARPDATRSSGRSAAGERQQVTTNAISQQRTQLQEDQLLNLLRSTNVGTLLNATTNNNNSGVSNASLLPASTSSPWLASGGAAATGAVASLPGGLATNDMSAAMLRTQNTASSCTNQAAANKPEAADGSSDPTGASSRPPVRVPSSISASAASSASTEGSSLVLYMDGDEHSLTEYQCLLRKQLEIFEAGPRDVRSSSQGRNTPILLGQVGLRCRHCASLPVAARTKGAIYFSQTIDGIYQIAQNMSKVHLCERCYRIPEDIQRRLAALRSDCRRASGGKEYWAEGVRALGVYQDGNILRMRRSSSSQSRPSSSPSGPKR